MQGSKIRNRGSDEQYLLKNAEVHLSITAIQINLKNSLNC